MSLEKFIKENKESFDLLRPAAYDFSRLPESRKTEEKPEPKVVELAAEKGKNRSWWNYAAVAALLALALSIGFYIGQNIGSHNIVSQTITTQPDRDFDIMLADVSTDLGAKESHYRESINAAYKSLSDSDCVALGLDEATRNDLKLKDETYSFLYQSLQKNPGNKRISEAILEYYQNKLDILNSLHERLTAMKTEGRP